MKKLYALMAVVLITTMLLTACGGAGSSKFKACQVTDTGGIDDKSFNATAWKGVQDAMKELGIDGKYLESQQQTDYEKNINAFIDEGCDIIITVGFLLGDATKAAAEANPDVKFSIVDYAYDPAINNVLGQVFNTDEAAFLAGYLAAGMTKTGAVGTFGGMQIPTVTVFMDGFYEWASSTTTRSTARPSRPWAGIRLRRLACSRATSRAPMTGARWARP